MSFSLLLLLLFNIYRCLYVNTNGIFYRVKIIQTKSQLYSKCSPNTDLANRSLDLRLLVNIIALAFLCSLSWLEMAPSSPSLLLLDKFCCGWACLLAVAFILLGNQKWTNLCSDFNSHTLNIVQHSNGSLLPLSHPE